MLQTLGETGNCYQRIQAAVGYHVRHFTPISKTTMPGAVPGRPFLGWEGMPRYFFHVIRGDALHIQDEVGVELPDDDFVVREGAAAAVIAMREEGLSTEEVESDGFRVVDGSGRTVAILLFRTLHVEHMLHGIAALTLLGLHATEFLQHLPEMLL